MSGLPHVARSNSRLPPVLPRMPAPATAPTSGPAPQAAPRSASRRAGWILRGLVASSALVAACRPSSDIQVGDVRTYTVPREPAAPPSSGGRVAPSRPAASGGLSLDYTLPEGWVDQGPSGMRLATVRTGAGTGGDSGEITIIPASGTLESNAARWQEQLTPGGDGTRVERALAAAEKVPVNGSEATILLLLDDAEENPQAILGAMIPVEPSIALFVKFKGSAEIARGIREPFTSFIRSIRWK